MEGFLKQLVFRLKPEGGLELASYIGSGEGIPGYKRRIVIMGQGLARAWHVQTPGRSL